LPAKQIIDFPASLGCLREPCFWSFASALFPPSVIALVLFAKKPIFDQMSAAGGLFFQWTGFG
jgi:hypothetical protein